jgi:arginine/lysine/ornithine decarboxylase
MDQSHAPLLDALAGYHALNRYGFTPPGHRQGRGVDDRVREVPGDQPFRGDVLASGGLDDRRMSNKYLKRAEDLMAEAVAAEQITPYPPGIPAVVPGERLTDTVVEYLRAGLATGMNVPDPADASLSTFRVVAQ